MKRIFIWKFLCKIGRHEGSPLESNIYSKKSVVSGNLDVGKLRDDKLIIWFNENLIFISPKNIA